MLINDTETVQHGCFESNDINNSEERYVVVRTHTLLNLWLLAREKERPALTA